MNDSTFGNRRAFRSSCLGSDAVIPCVSSLARGLPFHPFAAFAEQETCEYITIDSSQSLRSGPAFEGYLHPMPQFFRHCCGKVSLNGFAVWRQRSADHPHGLPLAKNSAVSQQAGNARMFPTLARVLPFPPRHRPSFLCGDTGNRNPAFPRCGEFEDLTDGLGFVVDKFPSRLVCLRLHPPASMHLGDDGKPRLAFGLEGGGDPFRFRAGFFVCPREEQDGKHERHGVVDGLRIPFLAVDHGDDADARLDYLHQQGNGFGKCRPRQTIKGLDEQNRTLRDFPRFDGCYEASQRASGRIVALEGGDAKVGEGKALIEFVAAFLTPCLCEFGLPFEGRSSGLPSR